MPLGDSRTKIEKTAGEGQPAQISLWCYTAHAVSYSDLEITRLFISNG